MNELPPGLSLDRDVLLHGRDGQPWLRRVIFGLICLIPLVALAGVFGQHATTSSASGPAAVLRVQAPKRLRGGLLYQVRLEAVASRSIEHPQFVLSPGWLEQNSNNSIVPDPLSQSSSNGRAVLSYGPLHAGQKLTVWAYFQVNPISVGTRDANVLLTDGAKPIAEVRRTLTVLP